MHSADESIMDSTLPPNDNRMQDSLLRGVSDFAHLSDSQLAEFASLGTYARLTEGQRLLEAVPIGCQVYLILSGSIKVSVVSSGSKELVVDYLDAPVCIGGMDILPDTHVPFASTALTTVEVLVFERSALADAVGVNPYLATLMADCMSSLLAHTLVLLDDLAFSDATHRVMRTMLNIATANCETRGIPIIEGITHADIAALSGVSRETASRVASAMARDGIVATKGRKIIVDIIALRERMESR